MRYHTHHGPRALEEGWRSPAAAAFFVDGDWTLAGATAGSMVCWADAGPWGHVVTDGYGGPNAYDASTHGGQDTHPAYTSEHASFYPDGFDTDTDDAPAGMGEDVGNTNADLAHAGGGQVERAAPVLASMRR